MSYIEREAAYPLAKKICDAFHSGEHSVIEMPFLILNWIDDIPAANVRPVVRGTWVGIDDFPHDDWECDHCGCVVESTNDPWNYYHFCPNCGCAMEVDK